MSFLLDRGLAQLERKRKLFKIRIWGDGMYREIIEAWYFTEQVEGISDIEDFLHCKSEIENTGFENWLDEQELREDYNRWLIQHGLL